MSWRRMSFPAGADCLAIGPLFSLHVHPPNGYLGFWQWWIDGGVYQGAPAGIVHPGDVDEPRQVARERAVAAALAYLDRGLKALDRHAADELYAGNLSGRARQRAMPWFWNRERLYPALCAPLPINVWLERGVDEYRWRAGPRSGTACLEGIARIAATTAAVKLLRIGVVALDGGTPWIEAREALARQQAGAA